MSDLRVGHQREDGWSQKEEKSVGEDERRSYQIERRKRHRGKGGSEKERKRASENSQTSVQACPDTRSSTGSGSWKSLDHKSCRNQRHILQIDFWEFFIIEHFIWIFDIKLLATYWIIIVRIQIQSVKSFWMWKIFLFLNFFHSVIPPKSITEMLRSPQFMGLCVGVGILAVVVSVGLIKGKAKYKQRFFEHFPCLKKETNLFSTGHLAVTLRRTTWNHVLSLSCSDLMSRAQGNLTKMEEHQQQNPTEAGLNDDQPLLAEKSPTLKRSKHPSKRNILEQSDDEVSNSLPT